MTASLTHLNLGSGGFTASATHSKCGLVSLRDMLSFGDNISHVRSLSVPLDVTWIAADEAVRRPTVVLTDVPAHQTTRTWALELLTDSTRFDHTDSTNCDLSTAVSASSWNTRVCLECVDIRRCRLGKSHTSLCPGLIGRCNESLGDAVFGVPSVSASVVCGHPDPHAKSYHNMA
jgi:hypothetical protein